MHSAKDHEDERQACCGPAPQPSGSCCGGAVESVASSRKSECCDATAREAGPEGGQGSCCGAPTAQPAEYSYGPADFVSGAVETPVGAVPRASRTLARRNRAGTWRVRWGFGRDDYRVKPGVYAVGTPGAGAPVLVTANYKLTFDQPALVRSDGLVRLAPGASTHAGSTSGARPARAPSVRMRSHGSCRSRSWARSWTTAGLITPQLGARSRSPQGQGGVRLPRDLRTGAGGRRAGVHRRGHEGRRTDAQGHLSRTPSVPWSYPRCFPSSGVGACSWPTAASSRSRQSDATGCRCAAACARGPRSSAPRGLPCWQAAP